MALIAVLVVLAMLLSLYFFLVLVGAFIAFIPWLMVGLLAGWIASRITTSPAWGSLGDIVIGLAGSVIGGVVFTLVTGHGAGGPFSLTRIVVAIVGAVALLIVIKAKQSGASPKSEVF